MSLQNLKKKLEIEFLKSKTYEEINDMFNLLNVKLKSAESECERLNSLLNIMKLTREQLIECFECVFTSTHSDGFKEAEMKDLLYNSDYKFLTKPKEGWEDELKLKLNSFGINYPIIKDI